MHRDFLQDVRVGLRVLLRAPLLTLTILTTVGLGIGATTAIFAAVDAALLRPLPYATPERLVRVYTDAPPFRFRFSIADYLALRDQQTVFEQTATYTNRTMTFSDGRTAELLRGYQVSWTYFSLLGITPIVGRDFVEADGRPGSAATALVTHGFWQRRLGGRTDAIGRAITLDGNDYTLAGVLPPRLGPLERSQEFFIAQQFSPPPRRGPFFYTVIARLRPGVSTAVAAEELHAINRRIFPIWKSSYQDDKATWNLIDLRAHVVGDVSRTATLALAAVALVWLIACANASNLLIARVTGRRRELAVRAALGASRARVVRHLLAESALLAIGSVAAGAAIAAAGIGLLRGAGATYFPRMQEVALQGRALWLLAGLALASTAMFGLIPALQGSRGRIDAALREGRSTTGGTSVRRLRRALVGSQFAVATPLLVVAALLLASLSALKRVDLGFDATNVVTGSIRLPAAQYSDRARTRALWDEMARRLESMPGVAAAGFADARPASNVGNLNNFDLEDRPTPPGQSQPTTPWIAVTPGYFRALGLTLVEGRLLEERDALRENLETVVVDRVWARRFFPNGSAVGRRLREGGCTTCPWTTVVGVVSDVKYVGLDQPDPGTVYAPMTAAPSRFLVVRTAAAVQSVLPAIRNVVRELEPGAPLSSVATIDDLVAQSVQGTQSLSLLVTAFASVALVLSVFGIYGVMAYYVQQHLKDIGIRIALGGSAADLLKLIVGQGMTVVGVGIAAGLAAAFGLARMSERLLFGVSAADPLVFAGVSALLAVVALAGCLVPAMRAIRVHPAVVLRSE
jgi:putative ABC transport system permease protein